MIRVFLDANIYFSGFYSEGGASSYVLKLIQKNKVRAFTTRLVLREADQNLRLKSDPKVLKAFRRFLKDSEIHVLPSPKDEHLKNLEPVIHPKDVPVLAAAFEAKADYLVTLDRRHFMTPQVSTQTGKMKIITPGDFLSATADPPNGGKIYLK